ncbi:PRD domain-containing protein [Terrilactibacillus sp. BCM23-1]|uniref:PRD domain-containing protein n=1 Tax=Terrilactibacillus tamarindi TaxID=2599694 RepID=A0A6N8CQW2_9BACI|nr:sigma-54-dependent transcriptional regulator [Terrilactibacillus tamarindi]MTT32552.1 PRD domain-containing protein [Terrilactibacillus tamarindi]
MKRIERIYQRLEEKCEDLTKEELLNIGGYSANDLADDLNILRNNISLELNNLVREGRIVKIKTRPVLYVPRKTIQKFFGNIVDRTVIEIQSLKDLYQGKEKQKDHLMENPFNLLIGSDGSLKRSIDQAKAAIVYPPNGLHTLILGPTGSGKTLFAHMMHNYAKYVGKMNEKSPFIVFNCADYYHNPQLLISQIFGHVKGAFTGAASDKEGMVKKADNGILFLDEVHRLPPEGQEMIFYFMDTGKFNKLGETERNRTANVLIIGATTEDPNSSFLKTFLRRIPITITMPSFHERQVKEKVDLTKYLLAKEASRINKKITVQEDVIKALIQSVTFGNIGQLKSGIQLVCAQGFLESIQEPFVYLNSKTLPQEMKEGLSLISRNRKENEEIAKWIDPVTVISNDETLELIEDDVYELPFDMYRIIEDKANLLKDEGVSKEEINKFVTTDIKLHIKSFYRQVAKEKKTPLSKLVDKKVLQLAEELKTLSESMLKRKFSDKFLYFMSLHIDGFLKRKDMQSKNLTPLHRMHEVIKENKNEYQVALKMKEVIEETLSITIPQIEVMYLTLLLISADEMNQKGKVGIVVATHGNSTATSMVDVTRDLLGDYNIQAVDMPLSIQFNEILDQIIDAVKKTNRGEGVLLLVDMGSLYYFEERIMEQSGVEVKAIDMVSTPLVLDAVRKANFMDMDLKTIYASLRQNHIGSEQFLEPLLEPNDKLDGKRAILTICSTGEGTAKKLKEMLKTYIEDITDSPITIIPVSTVGLKETVNQLKDNYHIIASVGVKNPKLNAPFISLEQFIEGKGEKILQQALKNHQITIKNNHSNLVIKSVCEDGLKKFLLYLNPYRVTQGLLLFVNELEKEYRVHFKNSTIINLVMHTAFAVERAVKNSQLRYTAEVTMEKREALKIVRRASEIIQHHMNVSLEDDELLFIVDLLTDSMKERITSK